MQHARSPHQRFRTYLCWPPFWCSMACSARRHLSPRLSTGSCLTWAVSGSFLMFNLSLVLPSPAARRLTPRSLMMFALIPARPAWGSLVQSGCLSFIEPAICPLCMSNMGPEGGQPDGRQPWMLRDSHRQCPCMFVRFCPASMPANHPADTLKRRWRGR